MPKKSKTKKTSNPPDKVPVGPGEVTVVLSSDEMLALTQILLFSKNVLTETALNLQKEGHTEQADKMAARSLLSEILFNKFSDIKDIGEPESRQVH